MKAAIYFDGLISQNLAGWISAGDRDEDAAARTAGQPVELRIGQETVAACLFEPPDGDAGREATPVVGGFAIPFTAAVVYTAMLSRGGLTDLSIAFGDVVQPAQGIAPALREIGAFRSLMLHEHSHVRISDVWFTTGSQLRLRIHVADSMEPHSLKLTFYQCDEDKKAIAVPIGAYSIEREGINFISVNLLNPYLPLLIAVSNAASKVPLLDLLPFPSLCQGGNHFAELRSLGMTGSYLENLRTVSDSLLRELFGWEGAPARSLGTIAININGATGAEPAFSKDARDWIGRMFDVPFTIDQTEAEHLGNRELERYFINDAAAPADRKPTLRIPHDALPTLSSLASRRLRLSPDMSRQTGPFLVADDRSRMPQWLVSMPALPSWLDDLQPRGSVRFYPVVSGTSEATPETELTPLATDVPLIVRYIAGVGDEGAGRTIPANHGADGPLLRSTAVRTDRSRTVSVLIATMGGHLTSFANLVSSLATQSLHESCEVIVVGHGLSPHFDDAARRLLSKDFPDRHRIVDCDISLNQSARVNLAADHAKGDFLVLAKDAVVLLEARTLEVLVTLTDRREVASSSCLLLKDGPGNDSALSFYSAGLFPTELSLLGRPFMTFGYIESGAVLANSTYPVVANSMNLCAVRADNWRLLGGLDARQFPNEGNDLDYGLRALDEGLMHLCTTGVAAYCDHRALGPVRDTHSSRYMMRFPLDRLLDRCTVVRRLDG